MPLPFTNRLMTSLTAQPSIQDFSQAIQEFPENISPEHPVPAPFDEGLPRCIRAGRHRFRTPLAGLRIHGRHFRQGRDFILGQERAVPILPTRLFVQGA